MLAIALSLVGLMPGFWLLDTIAGGSVSGWADPISFTATGLVALDPVISESTRALIFGLFASTVIARFVIPVAY